jgi:hypothetical protein
LLFCIDLVKTPLLRTQLQHKINIRFSPFSPFSRWTMQRRVGKRPPVDFLFPIKILPHRSRSLVGLTAFARRASTPFMFVG